MDENDSFDEQIEIKEAFTAELLQQIDTWNRKLKELNIPLKVDLKFIEEAL